MKDKIRPIYSQLQGYLSQAPPRKEMSYLYDKVLWEQFNQLIAELEEVSSKNYSQFKLIPIIDGDFTHVETITYRTNLGGLISRLHGEFFADESAPFSGMPSTVITQNQQQIQNVQVQILLEIQDKINEKLPDFKEGSQERGFLEKLKGSLSSVRNVSDLIRLLLQTGGDAGLTIEQVLNIFR